jgi:hypothetical protein
MTFDTQYTKFSKAIPGFTTVNLTADNLEVRMIDYKGQVLHAVSIPQSVA